MLTPQEKHEIHTAVWQDLVEIETRVTHDAGSYEYLCLVAGVPVFAHTPIGPVIRHIARPKAA